MVILRATKPVLRRIRPPDSDRNGDFALVISLLSPSPDMLSEAQHHMLNLARKRLGKAGP